MSKIQHFRMYINGEWVDSSSGKKIESLNPAIKLQDIRENRGYTWDWFWLSGSYFNFDKDAFFLKKARQWMAAYKIQQWFHSIRHNPKFKYGRKHINTLYLENFHI